MSKEELIKALALVEHQQRRVGAMRARLRAKRAAILASMRESERRKAKAQLPSREEWQKLFSDYYKRFEAETETPLSPRVLFWGRR